MKIKIIKNTIIEGKCVSIGDVLDVSDAIGMYLIGLKRAIEHIETEKSQEVKTDKREVKK